MKRTSQTNGNTGKPAWATIGARALAAPALMIPLQPTAADGYWLFSD